MNRRELITLAGGAAAWPVVGHAQTAKVPVVGFVHPGFADSAKDVIAALTKGLAEAGFVNNQNVFLEDRWAENSPSLLPGMFQELVAKRVAVLVAPGTTAKLAQQATTTIPIVNINGGDPVTQGLLRSLNKPEGNLTGISFMTVELTAKRAEIIQDLLPAATNFAWVEDQGSESEPVVAKEGAHAFRLIKMRQEDIQSTFAKASERGAQAIVVGTSPNFTNMRDAIVAAAAKYHLPAIYPLREYAVDGGLISYGASITDAYRQAGVYVGRILKGAKPSDLPVMLPTKFELVINLKTAKALGLTIPQSLQVAATEVIE